MTDHALVLRSLLPLPEPLAERLRAEGTTGLWEVTPCEWRAYFPAEDPSLARAIPEAFPAVEAAWESSEAVDWAGRYQASLTPIPIGRRFVVLPSSRLQNPWPARTPLRLVPGTAFGTGEHFTTASCLRALEELPHIPDSVLDVGCGSGILAAAACLLGASRLVACDTDPEACRIARQTRTLNALSYRVVRGSAGDVRGRFGLLFANILAETLVEIFPDLRERTQPSGLLIGSGIALPKSGTVLRAAKKTGFEMLAIRSDGAWSTCLWRL
jgi:ribosomal protein L11 methyltransferase